MATYIKSLKEDNGDIILPQTSADAVLASDDTTVQSKLDNYATVNKTTSSATTATNCVLKDASGNELHPTTDFTQVNGTVPTAKIASSAVTSAKLASSAVTTAKIADSAVTSAKIDWATLSFKTGTMSAVTFTNSGSWSAANVGSSVSVTGLEPSTLYKVTLCCKFTDGLGGEARLVCTGASTSTLVMYVNSASTNGLFGFNLIGTAKSSSSGAMTLQRAYSGNPVTNARYGDCTWFVERIG